MIDWDEDPELRNLRGELIASFGERRAELDARTAELVSARARARRGGAPPEAQAPEAEASEAAKRALLAIHVVVHKLAGAASSYGLTALGSLAEALDDLLSAELAGGPSQLDLLPARAALLSRALEEASAGQGDSPEAAASEEGRKLISDAESLLSAGKP